VNPDDSDALCAVIARREAIAGYFAGHTHRTRTRRFPSARNIPIVEIACVKDYPGAWAEYRVYEDGYMQLARRIDAPAALAWTEKTRAMFAGLYRDYALGKLSDRCFVQPF
jgi:3',5'-cyclic-AMP phosphodiesterase